MQEQKDLVFISSGGRTGTTFFGHNLSLMIDNCFSAHEPDVKYGWTDARTWRNIHSFGVWHMIVGRALGLTGGLPTALGYHTGKLAADDAVRRIRASRERYHKRIHHGLVIEANSQWHPILPLLRRAFPAAKIVLISRDENTWVDSWLRRGTRHTPRDPVAPFKRLTAATLKDREYHHQWPTMTAEERLKWEWRFVESNMRSFLEKDPLARLYRYEELFTKNDPAMLDLLRFVTTHEERCYSFTYDPSCIDARMNAA